MEEVTRVLNALSDGDVSQQTTLLDSIYGELRGMAAKKMAKRTRQLQNPVLKIFYQQLRSQGKHHQVAIIAVARKLLIHINTTMKNAAQTLPQNT